MLGHLTYLTFELVWGIPVLVLQWAVGRQILWRYRFTLLVAVLAPTVYLSLADGVAISSGIWTLHGNRITGILFGQVPLEEAIFFLITNAMVVQSVILVTKWPSRRGQDARRPTTDRKARVQGGVSGQVE